MSKVSTTASKTGPTTQFVLEVNNNNNNNKNALIFQLTI